MIYKYIFITYGGIYNKSYIRDYEYICIICAIYNVQIMIINIH